MRYLILLPFLLLLFTACQKTDREQLNGTWLISEIKVNGQQMFTTDKAGQQKIIDRVIQQQMAQLPPEAQEQEAMMRKLFDSKMATSAKTTLEFKEDNTFISIRYEGTSQVETTGKITLDEEKKEIRMKGDSDEQFTYELKDDLLKLSDDIDGEKIELTFKRK
ncbi:MAG TPA: copper resistance protein NlpE N-terminal domain-containing protein [Fluviicola sp.]|nr:copper resistance protein NlpE N-terminal domain-containing protein [Fluviicola sp.]